MVKVKKKRTENQNRTLFHDSERNVEQKNIIEIYFPSSNPFSECRKYFWFNGFACENFLCKKYAMRMCLKSIWKCEIGDWNDRTCLIENGRENFEFSVNRIWFKIRWYIATHISFFLFHFNSFFRENCAFHMMQSDANDSETQIIILSLNYFHWIRTNKQNKKIYCIKYFRLHILYSLVYCKFIWLSIE